MGHVYPTMDASQRSRDGVRLNRSARETSVQRFEQCGGLGTVLDKNLLLLGESRVWGILAP